MPHLGQYMVYNIFLYTTQPLLYAKKMFDWNFYCYCYCLALYRNPLGLSPDLLEISQIFQNVAQRSCRKIFNSPNDVRLAKEDVELIVNLPTPP